MPFNAQQRNEPHDIGEYAIPKRPWSEERKVIAPKVVQSGPLRRPQVKRIIDVVLEIRRRSL